MVLYLQECWVLSGPYKGIPHPLPQNLGPSRREAMNGKATNHSSQSGRMLLDRNFPAHQSAYSHRPRQANPHQGLTQIGRLTLASRHIPWQRSPQASQYCSEVLQATHWEMAPCG